MHTPFSSSRSTRRTAAVGALIVLASSLLCLNAATINGRGVLIGPSFTAEAGDKVRVTVSNVGRRPIGVQVLLLDLTDFEEVILTGAPLILEPLTSSFEDITLSVGLGIIAIIKFQSSGAGLDCFIKRLRVELRRADGEVHVFLEHDEQVRWPCRQCSLLCLNAATINGRGVLIGPLSWDFLYR